jgi:trans-L-3-hydroxyproline dehydratase
MKCKAILSVTDLHTAGEPVRIVTDGYPVLKGESILEKRQDARENHDHLRKLLMHEPRGHAEMYGVIPVKPSHPDADLAVLFMHGSGYSTMCGHATIAIGRWALQTGQVDTTEPVTRFVLECPCGPIQVHTEIKGGVIGHTRFESVRGYAHALSVPVSLPDREIHVDIAYGGAYYAFVSAEALGISLRETPLAKVKELAVSITEDLREHYVIESPDAVDLGFLYGTIITEFDGVSATRVNNHLCYFADGQLDRSPTGSGVTARLALEYSKDRVQVGDSYQFSGVSGGVFDGHIAREVSDSGQAGVTVTVAGKAYLSGKSEFVLDPDDPLKDGFLEPQKAGDYWQ